MAEATREFFQTLESRVDPAKAAGINSSYLFDVDGAGRWLVDVRDEGVQVTENGEGGGDCTIAVSDENFERLVSGELNPMTAYMTGKLKVKGDMGAAMKLQKLF